jgi:hypothetical protein
MAEPDPKETGKNAFFSRRSLILFVMSIIVPAFVGSLIDIGFHAEKRAQFVSLQASAYAAISQFAPWNVAGRYVEIVSTQGDDTAVKMAEQQQRQTEIFRSTACNIQNNPWIGFKAAGGDDPCTPVARPHGIRAFYLSAHVPFVLRLITALFDLLFHALVDQGFIGFVVAAAQIAMGVLLTRVAVRRKIVNFNSFYSWVFGMPLTVLALGVVAALPIWLLAFIGVTVFKGLPGAGLGAQAGGTAYLISWFSTKTVEKLGTDAIMKQVERIVGD